MSRLSFLVPVLSKLSPGIKFALRKATKKRIHYTYVMTNAYLSITCLFYGGHLTVVPPPPLPGPFPYRTVFPNMRTSCPPPPPLVVLNLCMNNPTFFNLSIAFLSDSLYPCYPPLEIVRHHGMFLALQLIYCSPRRSLHSYTESEERFVWRPTNGSPSVARHTALLL